MATVLCFPSVLGVRAGISETVERLEAAGHHVRVIDVLGGRTFDDYPSALAHQQTIAAETKQAAALSALDEVAGELFTLGFSSGCELAQWAAAQRPAGARGVVLLGGAIPMQYVEADWPSGVPAQTHSTRDDPFDDGPEVAAEFRRDVESAGGSVETFTYEGSGHLFNDPSLPAEFQRDDAARFYDRLLEFIGR